MHQETVLNHDVQRSWVKKQSMTKEHGLALLIFGILATTSWPVTVLGIILISMVIAIQKMPSLILSVLLIAIVSVLFPPLAGIMSFILLFVKIKYIIENFVPLLLGFILTGYLLWVSYMYPPSLFIFLASVLGMHLILNYLYSRKYTSTEAIFIMASVPLYILMIILPFIIKELREMTVMSDHSYEAHQQEMALHDQRVNNTGVHSVKGHTRELQDGSTTYVRPHVRTNPDGIKSNNLSAK